MPNWCSCDLIIMGPKIIREHFEKFAKDPTDPKRLLDMNQFVPYPKEFADKDKAAAGNPSTKDGYNSGGYNWCCVNWGTKWNFGDVELKVTNSSHRYTFDTAWSPPLPIIFAMSELYPHLLFTLKYYEQGMGFSGVLRMKDGKIIKRIVDNNYAGGRGG